MKDGDSIMEMNTKRVGNIGELKVALELAKYGIPIYFPFGDNEPSDLIAEIKGKLMRIQVKSTQSSNGKTVDFQLKSSMRGYAKKYTKEEVDLFFLYNVIDDEIYVIPFIEQTSISIRRVPSRQSKGVNFSKDLTLEKFLGG